MAGRNVRVVIFGVAHVYGSIVCIPNEEGLYVKVAFGVRPGFVQVIRVDDVIHVRPGAEVVGGVARD